MSDLHPTEGARFLLERELLEGDDAHYRAAVYTPNARFAFRAVLRLDGTAELERVGDDRAPEELASKLAVIARLIARGARGRRDDGLVAWPHRVLRWKGPGRG
jgi:hypothetical protein